jgi:hypothetical protein
MKKYRDEYFELKEKLKIVKSKIEVINDKHSDGH